MVLLVDLTMYATTCQNSCNFSFLSGYVSAGHQFAIELMSQHMRIERSLTSKKFNGGHVCFLGRERKKCFLLFSCVCFFEEEDLKKLSYTSSALSWRKRGYFFIQLKIGLKRWGARESRHFNYLFILSIPFQLWRVIIQILSPPLQLFLAIYLLPTPSLVIYLLALVDLLAQAAASNDIDIITIKVISPGFSHCTISCLMCNQTSHFVWKRRKRFFFFQF